MIKQIPIVLALVVLALVASVGYWYGFAQSRPQAVAAPVATVIPPTPTVDLSGDPLETFISRDPRYTKRSEITQKNFYWNHYKNLEHGFELDFPRFLDEDMMMIHEEGNTAKIAYAKNSLGYLPFKFIIYGKFLDFTDAKAFVQKTLGEKCLVTQGKNAVNGNVILARDTRSTMTYDEPFEGCSLGGGRYTYNFDVKSGVLWMTSYGYGNIQSPYLFASGAWCEANKIEAHEDINGVARCIPEGAIINTLQFLKQVVQ